MCACSVAQSCPTLCDPTDCSPPGSSVHGDSASKNTRVGSHFLLKGIFLTQGLNQRLMHWQADSLPLSHLGSPEWGISVCKHLEEWLTEQAPSSGSSNCYNSSASLPPQSAPTQHTGQRLQNRFSPGNPYIVCPSPPPSQTRGKGSTEMGRT